MIASSTAESNPIRIFVDGDRKPILMDIIDIPMVKISAILTSLPIEEGDSINWGSMQQNYVLDARHQSPLDDFPDDELEIDGTDIEDFNIPATPEELLY